MRNRSKEILTLVSDSTRLAEAREVAKKNRDKFSGTSKGEARYRAPSPSSPPPSAAVYNQSLPKRVVYEEKGEEEAEDPFEATRKRIERLKADEKEKTSTIRVSLPQHQLQQKKEPKRLSQVKVNPKIAATLMKPQNTVPAAKPSVETNELQGSEDLLGDLAEEIAPAATPTASVVPLEVVKHDADDFFDPFAASVPAASPMAAPAIEKVESNDWADFSAARAKPAPVEIPLNNLLAESLAFLPVASWMNAVLVDVDGQTNTPVVLPVMTPAPVPAPAPAPAPAPVTSKRASADPFANLCPTGQKPVQVPMGSSKTKPTLNAAQQPTGLQNTVHHGLVMDAHTSWTTQKLTQQFGVQPGVGTQLNGISQMGLSSMSTLRPQGVPMNPSAIPAQRTAVAKEDPFANLGF